MTVYKTGDQEGSVPDNQGVSAKIAAIDVQHKLITPCDCATWRDRAYRRSRAHSAGYAAEREPYGKQTPERQTRGDLFAKNALRNAEVPVALNRRVRTMATKFPHRDLHSPSLWLP